MGQLDGRTALVTGSTSGIGRGIAMTLAGAGAHVVVTGRNLDRGEEVAAAIRSAGGTASKAMVEALTRGWASEFGPRGIRVNTLTPGLVASEPDPSSPGNQRGHEMAQRMPAGRAASADDIAQAALLLASDASSYLHGTSLVVDGAALATRL